MPHRHTALHASPICTPLSVKLTRVWLNHYQPGQKLYRILQRKQPAPIRVLWLSRSRLPSSPATSASYNVPGTCTLPTHPPAPLSHPAKVIIPSLCRVPSDTMQHRMRCSWELAIRLMSRTVQSGMSCNGAEEPHAIARNISQDCSAKPAAWSGHCGCCVSCQPGKEVHQRSCLAVCLDEPSYRIPTANTADE